ncbi:hypothetical protein CL644_01720 [bacterium]|nr:hypothetical protein [bacterium]|tara:strand:- start:1702 stop:2442 length:741 start_codon:yes stop_codon:yes gene_type:complete
MKKAVKKILRIVQIPFIFLDFLRFRKNNIDKRFSLNISNAYPCIKDKTVKTGFDRHYVYHTAWAARVLREINPKEHTDIASSLFFSSIVSAFIPIKFFDYRPANLELDNLDTGSVDLTCLDFPDDSIPSLSCMHTLEHIGLGRYGDPIDPQGDIKAAQELARVVSEGGSLLFVVPIGETALVEFNAHRIYTYTQVLELFSGLELEEFSLIPEYSKKGGLIRNADPALIKGEHYACGCFWFKKSEKK